MLDDDLAVSSGIEALLAGGADQARWPRVQGKVLTAERDLMQHRDRVVDVGEYIHPGQTLLRTTGQGLEAVAGALRLGSKRPVGLTPGCDMRQLVDRGLGEQGSSMVLRRLDKAVCDIVTFARTQACRDAVDDE